MPNNRRPSEGDPDALVNDALIHEALGSEPLRAPRLEKFVLGLVEGKSRPQAIIDAGYKVKNRRVAKDMGAQFMRDPKVYHRYHFLMGRRADVTVQQLGITRAYVIEQLLENISEAMGGVEVDEETGKVARIKAREGTVVNQALKLIGTELGMFKEKHEHSGPNGGPIETRARVVVYLPDNGRGHGDGSSDSPQDD